MQNVFEGVDTKYGVDRTAHSRWLHVQGGRAIVLFGVVAPTQ